MPIYSDANGFPESGFPVLADESDRIVLNTLYTVPQRYLNYVIDVSGNNRLLGALVLGGTLTGVTAITMAGALAGVTTLGASNTVTLSHDSAPLNITGANAVINITGLNASLGTSLSRVNKGFFKNLEISNRPTVLEDYVALVSDLRQYVPYINAIADLNLGANKLIVPEINLEIGATTRIFKDGSNNLSFTDAVTGTKTLAQLVNAPMVYPGAGIALSTGSAWDTPITNNSANWNTAYGWGNHASVGYLTALPNHDLVNTTHHPVSGLTTGHFLKATGATTYGFAAHGLTYSDVGAQQSDVTLTALSGLTITQGSLIYGTGSDAFSILAKGTAGQVLKMNSGATAPEWGAASSGTVSFGTDYQIPFMKTTDDDFQYSASFKWDTKTLTISHGTSNVFVGVSAGSTFSGGAYNTYVGALSGWYSTSPYANSFFGYDSGASNEGGGNNTFIGAYTGYNNTSGANNVCLGYRAGWYIGGADANKLFIDNQARTSTLLAPTESLIYGEFNATPASQLLRVNGVLDPTYGIKRVVNVAKAEVLYTNTTKTTIITLPTNAVIWDVAFEEVIAFNGTGGLSLYIGTAVSDYEYAFQNLAGSTSVMNDRVKPGMFTSYYNIPARMTSSTGITFLFENTNNDSTQGQVFVYIHYSLH